MSIIKIDETHSTSNYDKEKKTLNGVPIWKLFIDLICHNWGEMAFDTTSRLAGRPEPGYSAAMYSAFDYMLTHLHKKLDAEELLDIYHLCTSAVENMNVGSNIRQFYPAYYGFILENVTLAAREEWASEKLILECSRYPDPSSRIAIIDSFLAFYNSELNIKIPMIFSRISKDSAAEVVNSMFADYYREIAIAIKDDDKLTAIVALCRKLEIAHVFPDGNQRTIVFVLLNKLLLENGFSPVILNDPIVFDGYLSKSELVESVKQGMENFVVQENKTILRGVPIWKLFIDLSCHSQGELAFDTGCNKEMVGSSLVREPGYAAAMYLAFEYMLKTLDKKLDAEELLNIHSLCVNNVKNLIEGSTHKRFIPGNYGFDLKQVTLAARNEWVSEKLIMDLSKYPDIASMSADYDLFLATYPGEVFYPGEGCYSDYNQVVFSSVSAQSASEVIDKIFADYYKEIKIAAQDSDILTSIVVLCRKLYIAHVFPDGNLRTIVFVLLNKLLLENGFSPVILEAPKVFGGHLSKAELVESVKTGMKYFVSLSEQAVPNSTKSSQVNRYATFAAKPEVSTPVAEMLVEESAEQRGKIESELKI